VAEQGGVLGEVQQEEGQHLAVLERERLQDLLQVEQDLVGPEPLQGLQDHGLQAIATVVLVAEVLEKVLNDRGFPKEDQVGAFSPQGVIYYIRQKQFVLQVQVRLGNQLRLEGLVDDFGLGEDMLHGGGEAEGEPETLIHGGLHQVERLLSREPFALRPRNDKFREDGFQVLDPEADQEAEDLLQVLELVLDPAHFSMPADVDILGLVDDVRLYLFLAVLFQGLLYAPAQPPFISPLFAAINHCDAQSLRLFLGQY